ncbi:MAG TPA: bacteriohopanetetrol glucosamine biosynthesis glycosyltransferase HpnI [Steroidobacteraceae bacterium]|nr:bacteriohopanetetrol glucosamine biosynthesis glycosyltransferase HpnI [Steroidobacteraceae bacterium]
MSSLGTLLGIVAAAYAVTALIAVLRPRRRWTAPGAPPPVTVLKPLCGAEPRLYECLRSFCEQAYPQFQIVFGVRDAADPATAVVRRLQREFPRLDLTLVVNAARHGGNHKVNNLINMLARARHEYLVLADSDISVPAGYLARVVAPLSDERVGIVTCPYLGRPLPGPWSALLAEFINGWFTPSVFVAALLGSRDFAFGSTIALRRRVLHGIGGFEAIVDQLADDYRLGQLTRRQGLLTVLSDVTVTTCASEPTLADLVRHELRWLRTIRAVRPGGYVAAVVTFPLPLALAGCLLAGFQGAAPLLLAFTAAARIVLHFLLPGGAGLLPGLLLPVSDIGAFLLWCRGFAGGRVRWRQASFRVRSDGSVYASRPVLDQALTGTPLEHD